VKLRSQLLIALCLILPHVARASDVGVFSEVNGNVQILRGNYYYQASPGVDVDEQDIVVTGDSASAQLDLKDGSSLQIAGKSRVLLSDYRLRDDGSVLKASIDVLSGWLRFAVSKLHGNASYAFNTPVMTVGIRGTQGVINAQPADGSLMLDEGHVRVQRVDADGNVQAGTETLDAGQYLSRARGDQFERRMRVPARFLDRMPARMKRRLVWRARLLQRRGIAPRRLRRMQRRDVLRLLNRHPAMKWRLRRRFQKTWGSDPDFRRAFAQRRQELRRRRFHRRHFRRLME